MKDDFDFDPDELESEFSEEFELVDDFEDDELFGATTRTAILSKNNMIALLCVKTADEGGAICRVDPRESRPSVQVYDDPEQALEWFNRSLRSSRRNGWQVVYDGLPLKG
jgi:hypothetical protein